MVMRAGDFLRAAEALPLRPLSDILAPGGLVVVAPHPDDESLGCGGLIAAAVAEGRPLRVVFVSDGAASHPDHPAAALRNMRAAEARAALACLGAGPEAAVFLDLPDSQVPFAGAAFDAAVAAIAAALAAVTAGEGPGSVLVTWGQDPHTDHRAAAAMVAALPPGPRRLAYPVWGHTLPPDHPVPAEAARGARLDIARWLPAKRRAIAAHRSQLGALPGGFSLDATILARFDRDVEIILEI